MSDYDAAVTATLQPDPAAAARLGMQQAVGTNPDLHAELQRVSEATGVPIGATVANPQDVKRQATLGSIDFDSLATVAPSTARLLADVEKAKISHDDVGGLSSIEKLVRAAPSYLGASTLAGLHDLVGVGAKLVDTANPFTTSAGDAAVLYKNDPEGLKRFNASPAGFLPRVVNAMNEASALDMANLSPEAKAAYGELRYATTDPSKAAYLSPVKVIGDAIRSLPTSLAMGLSIYVTKGAAAKAEADAWPRACRPSWRARRRCRRPPRRWPRWARPAKARWATPSRPTRPCSSSRSWPTPRWRSRPSTRR
jgi:hypothetical protein